MIYYLLTFWTYGQIRSGTKCLKNQPCDVIKMSDYPSFFFFFNFPLISLIFIFHLVDFLDIFSRYERSYSKCRIALLSKKNIHHIIESWCADTFLLKKDIILKTWQINCPNYLVQISYRDKSIFCSKLPLSTLPPHPFLKRSFSIIRIGPSFRNTYLLSLIKAC